MKLKVAKRVSYKYVLNQAGGNLGSIKQWILMQKYERAADHHHRAEALVELIEVLDCGSTGGFSEGQNQAGTQYLFNRWDWLYRKYVGNPEEVRFMNCFTYQEVKDFLTKDIFFGKL